MENGWKSALGLILVLVIITSCNNSRINSEGDPVLNWMKNNSYEIETLELSDQQQDLKQLKQIIGNAQLVCLGESRHDIQRYIIGW